MKRVASSVDVRFGAGVQSILLAFAGLVLLSVAFALFRGHTGGQGAALRPLLALGIFLLAAPAVLVKGLLAGWIAWKCGTGKGAAVAGIVLNGALLAAGIGIAVLAWAPLHSRF